MKKFLAMLLLVAVLASCTLAFAAEYVKFKGTCYVYKKAGSGKTKVIIKRGSVAEKVTAKGKWTKIKYSGKEGWVRTKYVKKDTKSTAAQVMYSGGNPDKTSKETDKAGKKTSGTMKTTGKLKLRSAAALSGKSLGTVPKGTKLTIKGSKVDDRGVTWYNVTYKGKTGWVSSVHTSEKEVGDPQPAEPKAEESSDVPGGTPAA